MPGTIDERSAEGLLLLELFFLTFFVPGSRTGSALRPRFLLFVQYWQDAGIRTRVELGGDE